MLERCVKPLLSAVHRECEYQYKASIPHEEILEGGQGLGDLMMEDTKELCCAFLCIVTNIFAFIDFTCSSEAIIHSVDSAQLNVLWGNPIIGARWLVRINLNKLLKILDLIQPCHFKDFISNMP